MKTERALLAQLQVFVLLAKQWPQELKRSNRLKIVLRNAANAIGNLKDSTPLRDIFQRINFRKGRVSAISATARKLAVIIWNVIVKGVP